MSSSSELEMRQADARYYGERVSLLRAKLYRKGLEGNSQLRELERKLELAERRLREQQLRESH